jgi:hypothetical protein
VAEIVVACVVAAILCASVGIWVHDTLTRDYSTGEPIHPKVDEVSQWAERREEELRRRGR